MKQVIFLMLSGLIALTGCRKHAYVPIYETTLEVRSIYQHNKKIDTTSNINGAYYYVSDSGDKDVFLYSNSWGENDDVFDNEYSGNIWFPVATGQASFSYKDGQLAEHRCYYLGDGGWGGYGCEVLNKGMISGSKNTDGSWEITIDVTFKSAEPAAQTSHVMTRRTFQLANY